MADTELHSLGGHREVHHWGRAQVPNNQEATHPFLFQFKATQASIPGARVLIVLGTSQFLPQVGNQLMNDLPNSPGFSPPNRNGDRGSGAHLRVTKPTPGT